MKLFSIRDHREILKSLVELKKSEGFSFSKLATKIGVQKTYVSRVMNKDACWSSDQAFAIGEVLSFTEDESDYFCFLVEEERCGLASRKKKIEKELKRLRRKHLRTAKAIQADLLGSEENPKAEYFSDPYHSIAHVYLTMPKYQKDMPRLAKTLGLKHESLMQIIRRLDQLEVIRFDKKTDTVKILKSSVHSPSGTLLTQAHQELFRAFAMDRAHRCSAEEKNRFSVVFAGDRHLQESIWAEFLKFLKATEELAKSTQAEKVYYMQFDLFPWCESEEN